MATGDLAFNNVISSFNLDVDSVKFVLAKKDRLSNLNFVFADFLANYIKRDYNIIIVNLEQSFHHYHHFLLKSGINLKTLREQGKIISIDILSEAESAISKSKYKSMEKVSNLSEIILNSNNLNCLKPLYKSIQQGIELFKSQNKQFLLFIDDLSIFMSIGVELKAIQNFVVSSYSSCTQNFGTLLIGSQFDVDDDEARQINYFSHLCDVEINIEGLKTGYSKDIQGRISCQNKNKITGTNLHRKMFFKVEDKGAKFFTACN